MLVAPLPYNGVIVGVLKVVSPWVNAYSANDVHTLELLNTLIGAAIAHAAQHARTEAETNAAAASNAFAIEAQREHIARIIAAKDFRIAFQPIVALRDARVVGYEALARFPGGRSPNEWFDDASHVGLGPELELTVARECLASLGRIPDDAYMAVNVSPEAMQRDELEALCLRHDPHRIVLEITEHTYIEDYDALMESTKRLKRLGVRFAIDDAGAGFASLRHVLRIRPDLIKLDGSITRNIDRESAHQSLASALLIFAQGTAAAIVAEGIETEAEASTLRQLGVAFGQGYFLGVPGALPATLT